MSAADTDAGGIDTNHVLGRGGIVAGILAVLGLGVGVTGFLAMGFAKSVAADTAAGAIGAGGLVATVVYLAGVVVVLLLGPVSAGLASLVAGRREDDARTAAVVGATGSFVGFYLMVVLAVVVLGLAKPDSGSGGGVNLFAHLGTVVLAGITTGIVGGVTPLVDARD